MNSNSDESNKLDIPNSTPNPEKLQGMEFVAKMILTLMKMILSIKRPEES